MTDIYRANNTDLCQIWSCKVTTNKWPLEGGLFDTINRTHTYSFNECTSDVKSALTSLRTDNQKPQHLDCKSNGVEIAIHEDEKYEFTATYISNEWKGLIRSFKHIAKELIKNKNILWPYFSNIESYWILGLSKKAGNSKQLYVKMLPKWSIIQINHIYSSFWPKGQFIFTIILTNWEKKQVKWKPYLVIKK